MQTENFQQSEKVAARVNELAVDFNPSQQEQKEMIANKKIQPGDSSKQFLPPFEVNMDINVYINANLTDTPNESAAKQALTIYKEKGPKAAVEAISGDLTTFEKEQFLNMSSPTARGGAGLNEEYSTKIAHERSAERWEAMKKELCLADANAVEKLKVAYLDSTIQAMSEAGGRYGKLDQYGVAAKNHFESQKTAGTNPMVRQLAGEISKEYPNIADPGGHNDDPLRISIRELQTYKTAQAKLWQQVAE